MREQETKNEQEAKNGNPGNNIGTYQLIQYEGRLTLPHQRSTSL